MLNHTKPKAYFDNLIKLLEEELNAEVEEDNLNRLTHSVRKREEKGTVWSEVRLKKISTGLQNSFNLEIERIANKGMPHQFYPGHSVLLYNVEQLASGNREGMIEATIKAIFKEDFMIISVEAENDDDLPDWISYSNLGVEKCFRAKHFDKMKTILKKIRNSTDSQFSQLRRLLIDPIARPRFGLDKKVGDCPPNLNQRQWEAVQKIIRSKDLMIIHGPPGTGKTTTLVEAVQQVVSGTKEQVLVCAPSNAAVDLLTTRLATRGLKVLRLGSPLKINDAAAEFTLESYLKRHRNTLLLEEMKREYEKFQDLERKLRLAFIRTKKTDISFKERANQLRAENKHNRKNYRKLEKFSSRDILADVQVITTTLYGATNPLLPAKFSTVFIDEAAQAIELLCWIPISKAQRLVMMGDHQQLPPVVKATSEAKQHELEKTLFEKVAKRFRTGVMLNTQYRMNNHIMQVPNYCFYDSELIAAESVSEKVLYADNEAAIQFFSTRDLKSKNQEAYYKYSSSYYNELEAQLLVEHLRSMIQNGDFDAKNGRYSIGIIAPYKGQILFIREIIDQCYPQWREDLNISVDSIDAFQGQERDLIYLSLVRSNNKASFGFLREYRRMNVAISRAKSRLIIFGNDETILAAETKLFQTSEKADHFLPDEKQLFELLIERSKQLGGFVLLDSFSNVYQE